MGGRGEARVSRRYAGHPHTQAALGALGAPKHDGEEKAGTKTDAPWAGIRTNPAFAVDVFTYVHNDADRAIKSQKDSMGSADYHESVGRLGLLIGASAQAAAALAPPFSLAETATGSSAAADVGGAAVGVVPYSESLRVAVDAFTAAAVGAGNMAMAPSIAASMDAALGSCARCSTLDPKP